MVISALSIRAALVVLAGERVAFDDLRLVGMRVPLVDLIDQVVGLDDQRVAFPAT